MTSLSDMRRIYMQQLEISSDDDSDED
jgi:hypothetical protein